MADTDEVTTDPPPVESPWERLADYDRPPVVETVMAVQFRPLRALDSVQIMGFWNEMLRGDYPEAEQQPGLQVQQLHVQPVVELPEVLVPPMAEVAQALVQDPEASELLQVEAQQARPERAEVVWLVRQVLTEPPL